ncbi:MAG TPA: adenylate/guanylate cyclase domain-containing protein [Abditibacterium sp.]
MTQFSRNSHAPTPSQSLPQRWRRGRQRAALNSLALLVFFNGALHPQAGADRLDSWWLRARFSAREWINLKFNPPKPDSRITIVEIDDKSSDKWSNDPFIAWGGHLADAINQLNRSGARLVALDWTQPIETDARMKWNHDERLGAALGKSNRVVFVKMLRSDGKAVLPAPSLLNAPRDAYGPNGESNLENLLGFADLVSADNVQTSFFPELPPEISPRREVSFAARIAERSGLGPLNLKAMPLRNDGSLLINYSDGAGKTGSHSPFERVSLFDVATSALPDARFKDKIVLIGATSKGGNDIHHAPFTRGLLGLGSRQIPGVELQAHAVKTLLNNNAIAELEGAAVWFLSFLVGAFGVWIYTVWEWARAARAFGAAFLAWMGLSFVLFWSANFALPVALPLGSLVLGCALMGGYRALSEERERMQVMKIWGRHQDPRLIEELLANPEWRGGQGREIEVTVLFADLKNFTKTVEHLTPTQALEALNRYLALLSSVILEHGGLVDKYLGDGLMAQWGAPAARKDHATAAVHACLDIGRRVSALTQEMRAQGQVAFEARLTLHTGPVVAGPLGSEQRLEYTIIGDTVNVSSRLQETAKSLGCDFLISETTCGALDETIRTGRETQVEIRGRQAPLRVFEVLDDATIPLKPIHKLETAKTSQNS